MPVVKKIKGRYEIRATLGQGGMGVVYRAYDPPPMGREVALKTLLEFNDRTSLQLFYKECEVLKSISHPNIVEIFDIGEFDDGGAKKPFFVMPLLPGQTLDGLIRNSSHRLTVERVVDIMAQTCRGLQAAHERGLIHRDLKPSNLFVMEDDSVKIIDFGVARTVDAHSRSTGFQKGTLLYMAPEQVQLKPVSAQSDIFSLGVVCYEALTRRQPFRGSNEEEVVKAILNYIPPAASEINPLVSQTISRVIHKAMAKQPWNRFDSAKEFGETIQKALRNEPIELFDPSRIQPRIQRATKALASGDYQFAAEIVSELEAEGNIDPQLTLLRTQVDQVIRQRTITQLLESARARFEEEEDPLALQKIQQVLELDPNNVIALGLKSKIEDRRSERQVERWLRLAHQHIDNHAYGHAREAVENVLQLRSSEARALRLLSIIQANEKEYLRTRQQKAQAYQNALNSWKNGEISEALSQMALVLELDRQAPDTSSPETSATYQHFYNQVRSEHDAINNAYAQGQRALAEHDCARALKICEEFLTKYPNHALFQAFQFEVKEQQRQELSAFIAEVDRKLDAERDLDAKISLLRDALSKYPGEAHFERSLRIISDKRDLVNSILARARAHEEHSQIAEAIADMEILRTIYSPYPGLQLEIERLQKRREQQARDLAKARWLEQVDQQLETGYYSLALELLQKAKADFPNDPELVELEKLATRGAERAILVEQMVSEGQELCRQAQFEQGLERLRQAQELDSRNAIVRSTLRDNLIERARILLESDYRTAESLVSEALDIDPNHALARGIQTQIQDRKREETIAECVSQARRLQAAGDLESACAMVERGLSSFPAEPRLAILRDTLNKEFAQLQQQRRRVCDLEQVRNLQEQIGAAEVGELASIYERSRGYVEQHPDDPEFQSIAQEIDSIVKSRRGVPPIVELSPVKTPSSRLDGAEDVKPWHLPPRVSVMLTSLLRSRAFPWAGGAASLSLLIALAWSLWPHHGARHISTVTIPVEISTSPQGATVRINGETRGISDLHLDLDAGNYQLQVELPGYESVQSSFTAKLGSPPRIELMLRPLAVPLRIVASDLDNGKVWLDDAAIGDIEGGSFTLPDISPGDHVLRIAGSRNGQDATIQFHMATATMPSVNSGFETHQLQLVTVSSASGSAQVKSTIIGSPMSVDDKPRGQLDPNGLLLTDLKPGEHELVLGEGNSSRRVSFDLGSTPALDAIVFSDRDVGSLLVEVGENDAQVFLDGRAYPHKSQRGELRIPNLRTAQHTVTVRKEGFKEPADQVVLVKKGQESRIRFALEPIPKLASLILEHLPSGAQLQLDGATIGAANADGKFTAENIVPGDHVLSISAPGYPTRRLDRQFGSAETIRMSMEELNWKRLQGTIEVTAPAQATFTLEQDGRIIRQFTGPQRLALEEGSYVIAPQGSSGSQSPVTVAVVAGEVRHVNFQSSAGGMEHFHPDQWVQQNNWYVHRGGLVLYDSPPGPATFVFTLRLHFSHPLFSRTSRVRWLIGYIDAANFTEMQMDNKFVYRTDVVDGNKHDWQKQPHRIPSSAPNITLRIDILSDSVIQQYTLRGDHWETLYSWETGSTPSLYGDKKRNFAGKFGFQVPQEHDIEIANFKFTPQ